MLQIQKRNEELVSFNPSKILNRIKKSAKGLKINADQIFVNVVTSMPTEGIITTTELDNLIAATAAPYTGTHYDYSKLAAIISISSFHKSSEEDFYEVMAKLSFEGIVSSKLLEIIESYGRDNVQNLLDYTRDEQFDFFAWKTMETMYLLKNSEGIVVERPQQMYLRIALWLSDSFEQAKELYNLLSRQLISCATPIMINSGTSNAQLASCVLHQNNGDSRPGLLQTLNDISNYSSNAAGIGLGMSNIRSKKSRIKSSGGHAGGLLKYLKIVNEALRFFNQNGKRPGSAAIYLEPWHMDIMDLLEIKKNTGSEEMRARDLFTALMIPDNFMRAVKNDADWYLFCPNELKKAGFKSFHTIWGEEYEQAYNSAVEMGLGEKVSAQEIMRKIIESQIETGVPYILFKDSINRKTNHQNYGTISQSNLCAEIVQYNDEEFITAICTLASQVLKNYIKNGEFNFDLLGATTQQIVKALNKVIDINKYATEKGKNGGLKQRAIAIGVQGLADAFYMLDYSFTSPEAKQLNKDIFETIYYNAIRASCDLVKSGQYEVYDGFHGSPMSKGIFQFDMWGLKDSDLSGRYNWQELREDVMNYGICNSLFTGQMPVASSAKITGSYEMTEPMDSNLFNRRVIGGEFLVANKYLMSDLEKIGLWNENVKNDIIINNGSIQEIDFTKYMDPEEKNYTKKIKRIEFLLEKYKTVWEYKQRDLIDLAADRAVFIDQTQSMNLYFAPATVSKLNSSMFYAWEIGLKTGSYYIRSKAISTGAKHLAINTGSVALELVKEQPMSQPDGVSIIASMDRIEKPTDSPFDCFGCSA